MSMDQLAEAALARFGLSPRATATLCNVSENHTYRVEDPERRTATRCASTAPATARRARSSPSCSGSTRCARTAPSTRRRRSPAPRRRARASTSASTTSCCSSGCPERARPRGRRRARRLPHARGGLGAHARARARVGAARRLRPPALGLRPHARARPGTGAAGRTASAWGRRSSTLLGRLDATIAARLAAYGQPPERYGLVHADIRLANLLVDDAHVRVIDFDDCGFTWFMYDFATTVSFMEDHPRVPELQRRLARGLPLRGAARPRRRGRARHLRDAAPAAARGLDRLAPHVRHRGRGARRRLHRRHLRAGGALPVNPLPRRARCSPRSPAAPSSSPAAPRASARASPASSRARAPTSRSPAATRRSARRRRSELGGPLSSIADVAKRRRLRAHGGRDGRAARRPRRPVRERRHLPRRQARRHERAGHRRDLRHQRQGHDAVGQGRARPRSRRSGHGRVIVTSSITGPITGLPRLVALRRDQGRAARLHPHRGDRARPAQHHDQRGDARQHRDRGARRARRRVPRDDGGVDPAAAAREPSRTSATPRCSSPPTRPATSPGRRSSSTAARCCPSALAMDARGLANVNGGWVGVGGCRLRATIPTNRAHPAAGRTHPLNAAVTDAAEARAPGPTALAARERLLAALPGPGERLGAERELAERLGVSRSTIRAALGDLERGGVIRRTRGRGGGIFVAERKVERDLTSLAGLPAYLRRSGFQSDARVLSTATVEADAGRGARRWSSRRARSCSRSCACAWPTASRSRSSARCFPAERFPGLLDRSLGGSLYELLRGALRARARRGGGAHRGGGRRRRRGAAARAAPRRAAAGGRAHGVGRRRAPASSARTTSSAPTVRGSWSAPCHGRNQVVESRKS